MERECIDSIEVPESRLSDNCFLDEWPECGVLTDRMLDVRCKISIQTHQGSTQPIRLSKGSQSETLF